MIPFRKDTGWRPDHYRFEVLGCRHTLEFPVVKLIDYADRVESLAASANPFALVTVAHLRTRQTKGDPQARYRAKLALVRSLSRLPATSRRLLPAECRRPEAGDWYSCSFVVR